MAAKKKESKKSVFGKPAARKRNGRTSTMNSHTHSYKLDKNGNGETSRDKQHVHSVRAFTVQQAGKSSHSHSLT